MSTDRRVGEVVQAFKLRRPRDVEAGNLDPWPFVVSKGPVDLDWLKSEVGDEVYMHLVKSGEVREA